jgi:2-polyprenyl-3-methyl-5-hydroxy-6-metoxy-1,4-benzoquinol methylase
VWGRWRSCPFDAVEASVPSTGRVLDVGCGHGSFSLSLALASRGRSVTGVDVDSKKLDLARQAAKHLGLANVQFDLVEPDATPSGRWDAVCFVDVLYLLGEEPARRLLAAAAASLASRGVVLVKEMDTRPSWKHQLNRLQELVATRVARITQGRRVEVVPPESLAAELEGAGLVVSRRRLDHGSLHPHHLVIGRRPPR